MARTSWRGASDVSREMLVEAKRIMCTFAFGLLLLPRNWQWPDTCGITGTGTKSGERGQEMPPVPEGLETHLSFPGLPGAAAP